MIGYTALLVLVCGCNMLMNPAPKNIHLCLPPVLVVVVHIKVAFWSVALLFMTGLHR